jgi:uncharacterized protein YlxW (UPF0749 family)
MALRILILEVLLYLLISGVFSLLVYTVIQFRAKRHKRLLDKIRSERESALRLAQETKEAEKVLRREEERCGRKLL